MVALRLIDMAEIMAGRILQGSPYQTFRSFTIDSRTAKPGDFFFAIMAQRNGHEYVADAAARGAGGAAVSQKTAFHADGFAIIHVEDTLRALQKLARKILFKHPAKVVGITGSIGKTTTKEFAASLLSPDFSVLKSEGNYNNHLGLPLSLLKLERHHQIALLEMGMNAPGEIAALTRIAPPDVAAITNIRPVHLKFFHTMEDIALAKKEILDGTPKDGIAVVNGDDPLVQKISAEWKGEKILFGLSPGCAVQAYNLQKKGFDGISFDFVYGGKTHSATLPFCTEAFLYNFLASSAIAWAFSVPSDHILSRIPTLKPLSMRGILLRLGQKILLVDDSYNSNPEALEIALKDWAALPAKRKVAVLGDMLELGEKEVSFHARAGMQAALHGWDILITVGLLSQHMADGALEAGMEKSCIFSFQNSDGAANEILSLLKEGDLVLVKGSRAIKMETIVNAIKKKE